MKNAGKIISIVMVFALIFSGIVYSPIVKADATSTVSPIKMIENYENYGSNTDVQLAGWTGNMSTLRLDTDAYGGSFSANFTSNGSWPSQEKLGYSIDMAGYERLRIYAKCPNSEITMRIQFTTPDGITWYMDKLIRSSNDFVAVDYPLTGFFERLTGSTRYDPYTQSTVLTKVTLELIENALPKTIKIDNFMLVNGGPPNVPPELLVEGFETYGSNSDVQIPDWNGGESTLRLDTEAYGGVYSVNFTTSGSWAYQEKAGYGVDMTQYEKLRVYIKNNGSPVTLRMQITTADGNTWYMDKPVPMSNIFSPIDYPLSGFTERWVGSSQYDPNTSNPNQRVLYKITFVMLESASPKTIKVDNIVLANGIPPVQPELLVEGFEDYGSDTNVQVAGWSPSAGSSLKLDADSYGGNYSANFTETSPYGYQSNQNYNIDLTGYGSFRLFAKNAGVPITLRLQITSADGNTWYLDKVIDTTSSFKSYDYSLADFTERWAGSQKYNPKTSIANQRILTGIILVITDDACPRSVKIDNLMLKDDPIPVTSGMIIENFENYGTDTSTQLAGWTPSGSSFMLDTESYDGGYSSCFSETVAYGVQSKSGYNIDMTGYERLRLFAKNSGERFTLRIQITTANGSVWTCDRMITNTGVFETIDYPLADFKNAGGQQYFPRTTVASERVLTGITLSIVDNLSPLSAKVDNIMLVMDHVNNKPEKVIEKFENYGTNTNLQLSGWTATSGLLNLNTDFHCGDYSAIFTSTGPHAVQERHGYAVDMTGYDKMRVYVKNLGATPFLLRMQITTLDGATWYLDKSVGTSSTFIPVDYPLSEFHERWSGIAQYNPSTSNLAQRTLEGIIIVFNEPTSPRSILIDDISLVDTDLVIKDEFYIASQHVVQHMNKLLADSVVKANYQQAVSLTKAAGFNMIEINGIRLDDEPALEGVPVDMVRHIIGEAITACDNNGVKALVTDPYMGGFWDQYRSGITATHIKAGVDYYNQFSKAMLGYNVWDEPFAGQNSIMSQRLAWIKKYDATSTMFINLLPSYGPYTWENGLFPEYVNNYNTAVNPSILAEDYYVFGSNTDCNPVITGDNVGLWRDMGFFRKLSNETGKPFWFYIQGVGDTDNRLVGNMTIERIRFQTYFALAYGVKNIDYYTSYGLLMDADNNLKSMYTPVKNLNTELMVVGQFLFNKQNEAIYHANANSTQIANYYLDNLADSSLIQSIPSNTIAAVFHDSAGKKYILVTNKTYNSAVSGNVVLKSSKKISVLNTVTGALDLVTISGTEFSVHLDAGSGILYAVE